MEPSPVPVGASAAVHSNVASPTPTPVFRPPLFEQRQGFILSTLRKHRVREVLEVGCERGRLLQFLAQPEFKVDTFPFHRYPPRLERRLPPTHWTRDLTGLVLERLEGLDLDVSNLKAAVNKLEVVRSREAKALALTLNVPPPTETATLQLTHEDSNITPPINKSFAPLRFVPLRAAILQGGLEIFNERFRGIDAIVASEVIEHLHEPVLDAFAPILLGRYRPRLLVVTTPNYAFNVHFPRGETQPSGIDDPTGRTGRKFRHPDHKFEWDTAEFRSWCERAAERFGYEVEIGALGMLNIERRRGGRLRQRRQRRNTAVPAPATATATTTTPESGSKRITPAQADAAAEHYDEDDDDFDDDDTAEERAEIEALLSRANEGNRFASQTAVFKRLGKGPSGTNGLVDPGARARSRSTARTSPGTGASTGGSGAFASSGGGVSTDSTTSSSSAVNTDAVDESDYLSSHDTRGRSRTIDPILAFSNEGGGVGVGGGGGPARRPSVVSGSESEAVVGPLQSFQSTAGLYANAAGGESGGANGANGENGGGDSRPSLQQNRRASRSRKPEHLPWLSSAGPETGAGAIVDALGGARPLSLNARPDEPLSSTTVTTPSPLSATGAVGTQDISRTTGSLLTSTGGLDGVTLTPSPTISMVQHKLLWEATFPAFPPSRPSSPSPSPSLPSAARAPAVSGGGGGESMPSAASTNLGAGAIAAAAVAAGSATTVGGESSPGASSRRRTQPKIIEAVVDVISAEAELLRVPAVATSSSTAGLSGADDGRVLTVVEARLPLWSAFRDDRVRRNAGGSISKLLSGLGLLPRSSDALSGGGATTAVGRQVTIAPVKGEDEGTAAASGSAPAPALRPLRDPSTVMASDGVAWELRLLARPVFQTRLDDSDEDGTKGGSATVIGGAADLTRQGLVDGEDDGNEEDDEDDDSDYDDDDRDFDEVSSPSRGLQSATQKRRHRQVSSARTNNDLYLVYYGPEPTAWLSSIEAEDAEAEQVEAERARERAGRAAEVEARVQAIAQLGGWGNPALAGLSLDEMDRKIADVRLRGEATGASTAPDSSSSGAGGEAESAAAAAAPIVPTEELTGWE